MIEAKYLRNGKIAAMFDDILVVFEDDMNNTHRQALERWLKNGRGNRIEPAEPARSVDDINVTQDTMQ